MDLTIGEVTSSLQGEYTTYSNWRFYESNGSGQNLDAISRL